MRLNYKKLGNYIELVSCVNTNLQYGEVDVRGVSNNKEIIQTRANNEGRDFDKFYVVEPNEFIYNSRTSRMGEKVGLGYNDTEKTFITSFNNTVFRVKDEALFPMYLLMWFKRPEFDRYARVHSWGSSTEIFSWEEMCNVTLPIPTINRQREIVGEYNVIQNRIILNQQLIQKLEDTAEALYRHWFVDFEFPDENRKPYKSSGGEMVWCEEFGKDLPKGWKVGDLNEVVKYFISKRGKSKSLMHLHTYNQEFKFPVISAMNIANGKIVKYDTIPYVKLEDYNNWMNPKLQVDDVLLTSEAPLGATYYIAINSDLALSQRLFALRTRKEKLSGWYLYQWLNTPFARQELEGRSSGTTVFGIKLSELRKLSILIPRNEVESTFTSKTNGIARLIELKNLEIQKQTELMNLLLSKLATIQ